MIDNRIKREMLFVGCEHYDSDTTETDDDDGSERVFTCGMCGQCFKTSDGLSTHTRMCITNTCERTSLICGECGGCFRTKAALSLHCDTHAANMRSSWRFVCDECGTRFKTKNVLNNHMVIHTGIKSHTCNICNRSFGTRNVLVRHFNIHTGKKFPCTVCHKEYAQQHSMVLHRKKKHL
jgi:KRAB domain-containing zinc finger protein